MRTTAAAFLLSLAAASAFAGEPAVYGVPFDDGEAMPGEAADPDSPRRLDLHRALGEARAAADCRCG